MSDPAPIRIALTPQAEAIVASYQTLPGRILMAIVAGMDKANQLALSNIQAKHLTGKGPFPVEEHKLGRVTGLLRASAWASGAQPISNTTVQSGIGSNVKYARIHEVGGRISHPARQMKLRHRLDARGNLVKQLGNSNLLMFARAGHKRARETTVQGKAYVVEMPARAPFRTGIEETAPTYKATISQFILAEWERMKS